MSTRPSGFSKSWPQDLNFKRPSPGFCKTLRDTSHQLFLNKKHPKSEAEHTSGSCRDPAQVDSSCCQCKKKPGRIQLVCRCSFGLDFQKGSALIPHRPLQVSKFCHGSITNNNGNHNHTSNNPNSINSRV